MNFWSFLGLASAADMRALREELQAAKEENEALRLQASDRITAAGQEHMSELRELLQTIKQEAAALRTSAEQDRTEVCAARRELLTAFDGAKAELSGILLESNEKRSVSEKLIMRGLDTHYAQSAEVQRQIGVLQELLEASEKQVIGDLKVNHAQGAEVQQQMGTLRELFEVSETEMTALRDLLQENASRQEAAFLHLQEILSNLSAAQGQGLENLSRVGAEQGQRLHDSLTRLKEDVNEAKEVLLGAVRIADPRGVLKRLDEDQRKMQATLLETQNTANMLPEMKDYLSMLWEVTKLVWVNDLLSDLEKEL